MLDHVFEELERLVIFRINLFGQEIEISNTVFVTWIIMAIIIVLALIFTKGMSLHRPGKLQTIAELYVETVNNLCKGSIGHLWKHFTPYIGTLLLYLGFSNIIMIIDFIPGLHMYPPTKDINVTGALALISMAVVLYSAFRFRGLRGFGKSFLDPMPIMAPFKVMELATKPLSLCLRLFGNVVAAFIIMALIIDFMPYLGAPFSIYFDLFDGILQAFIFVYLTTLYIGEAVEVPSEHG